MNQVFMKRTVYASARQETEVCGFELRPFVKLIVLMDVISANSECGDLMLCEQYQSSILRRIAV